MDYYTDFCFEIEGSAAELQKMFRQYELLVENPVLDDDTPIGLLDIAKEENCYPGVVVELNGDTATITAEEGPSFTVVEKIIQLWMQRCNRDGWISFAYSMSASRPTTDAYGGGVVWISKDRIVEVSSSDLIHMDPLVIEKLVDGLVSDTGKDEG